MLSMIGECIVFFSYNTGPIKERLHFNNHDEKSISDY